MSKLAEYRYPISYLLTSSSSWQKYGLKTEAYLAMAGIDASKLHDPEATISGEDLITLNALGCKLNQTGIPPSILVAEQFSFTNIGLLGLGIIASENLNEALELIQRYHSLSIPGLAIEFHFEDDALCIDYEFDPDFSEALPFLNEILVCVMRRFADLFEKAVIAQSIHFAHIPDYPLEMYESFLGCPVFTRDRAKSAQSSSQCRMRFRAEDLNTRLKHADAATLKLIKAQLENALQEQQPAASWLNKVAGIWRTEAEQNRFLTQTEMAERLNVSTRTLVRKLADEGHSYRDLTNKWRIEKAKTLLRKTDIPVSEVATQVGFGNESAFFRFFKEAEGITPRRYRISDS